MDEQLGPPSSGGSTSRDDADVWIAGVRLGSGSLAEVAGLRATVRAIGAVRADQLRRVARLAARCEADARAALARGPLDGTGAPSESELVHTVVTHELMVVLGISKRAAENLEALATRLVRVLPATLAALEEGLIDLPRAEALAQETALLHDAAAREVQALVLPAVLAGQGPWDGPSPRQWRARVQRAVVKVDADAARRRREAAIRDRMVRAWPQGDGTGVLQIVAADVDIALADRVITDLAQAWPATGADGVRLSMDQRRVDALMDVFTRIAGGRDLPSVTARREREVGLVLHADTLFGDGPAKGDPGELRGFGAPAPVDPQSAAGLARAEIGRGAATRVLLVDADGMLRRTIRLPHAPTGGWTRSELGAAVVAAVPGLPSLRTHRYAPTVAIAEHVRTAQPRCASYDCARTSCRCDLDHDRAWPRGPTCVTNLCPRCRRDHELKTRGLVSTRLHGDGSVSTTTLLGVVVRTRPEPLPGHGLGETYSSAPRG
jgi:hypothetical protein